MDVAAIREWREGIPALDTYQDVGQVETVLGWCRSWLRSDDEIVEMLAGNSLAESDELADAQTDDDRSYVIAVRKELEAWLAERGRGA